jgi:hypothetical protein
MGSGSITERKNMKIDPAVLQLAHDLLRETLHGPPPVDTTMRLAAELVRLGDNPPPLGGPAEDRTNPPDWYHVWWFDAGPMGHWVVRINPSGNRDDKAEAVAACWQHRDRIVASATAELRQQLAEMRALEHGLRSKNAALLLTVATLGDERDQAEREAAELRQRVADLEAHNRGLAQRAAGVAATSNELRLTFEAAELRRQLAAHEETIRGQAVNIERTDALLAELRAELERDDFENAVRVLRERELHHYQAECARAEERAEVLEVALLVFGVVEATSEQRIEADRKWLTWLRNHRSQAAPAAPTTSAEPPENGGEQHPDGSASPSGTSSGDDAVPPATTSGPEYDEDDPDAIYKFAARLLAGAAQPADPDDYDMGDYPEDDAEDWKSEPSPTTKDEK